MVRRDLNGHKFREESVSGELSGSFVCAGLRPAFAAKAEYYGLLRPLLEAISAS
jgi:pilus assembly protein CpaF